jgi:hypothetical protein
LNSARISSFISPPPVLLDLADGFAFICIVTAFAQLAFLKKRDHLTGQHARACYTALCIYGTLLLANICLLRAIKFQYLLAGRLIVIAYFSTALGLVLLIVSDILVPFIQTGSTQIIPSLLSITYRSFAALIFFLDAFEYIELERFGISSFAKVNRCAALTVVLLTWSWLFLLARLDETNLWSSFSLI